jgi:hypothetical protein
VFTERECEVITAKLDAIVAIGRKNLARIVTAGEGSTVLDSSGGDVDYIVKRAVDWYRLFREPIPIGPADEYRGHF